MSTSEQEEVLAAVKGFLASISNKKPPFAAALNFVLPDSYAALSHPEGLIQCKLGELISRLEEDISKIYESGAKSVEVSLFEPGPDVWVGGRFAAFWAGYSFKVDGEEKKRGVNAFTLFKREDGWKIGGLADTQWEASEAPPQFVNEVTSEMMAPNLDLCVLLNDEKWDQVIELMLPGGGATYQRFPHTLLTPYWPEFFSKMREMLEKSSGYVEQKLMDWDGRSAGELGLVWTPFTVTVDGDLKVVGYNIFTMLKRDGKWLISGCQDG
ncbi:hypothetical protein L207DRAFT_515894 [Hyaloscypha variabilis F]|jgi:hypothetical protein|uniref:SnoaL-like domain-containing protein n=1 Tax=Hyaloscypha variabilis (strain UAMH 11265 / GT02V1 / F) TaxID=1149755 RepID=A0A2J6RCD2_HYAVF|nr:hypothetical protein L207DRAFT_515894 [Hyaloscypha variabilis F]